MPSHSKQPSPRVGLQLVTSLALALRSIRAHKLRSFLTLLGVIIGVASVILVGAAVEGLGVYAEESTAKAFGTDSFLIAKIAQAGNISRRELYEKVRQNKQIRVADLDYLEITTGDRILYTPYMQRIAEVSAGSNKYEEASVIGASALLPEIRDVSVDEGRFFTPQEEASNQFVCVIGRAIADELFPLGNPIGRKLRIKGFEFEVVGLQEPLGSAFGRSLDGSVYIPHKAFARLYGTPDSLAIFAKPRPETGLDLESALDVSRSALRVRYRQRPGTRDLFDTLTPDAIRGFLDQMLGLIAAIVVPVTSISLLVGGIVIMNIMLVSVTERTREIGIRKAMGARKGDILLQFLLEAVTLSAVGGLLGILLGAALTQTVAAVFDIGMSITLPYVLLAIFVSTAVGVLSGWYPANRAASLDPIVALRAE